jgi:hypothetical protein
MYKWFYFDHQGGLEFGDIPNNYQENKRNNDLLNALTFHQ